MIINHGNLSDLFRGYQGVFNQEFRAASQTWRKIATLVMSLNERERYGWIGQFPQLREWIGDRHLQNLLAHDYTLVNRKFESTVAVARDAIEDDRYGIYAPLFAAMGQAAGTHPDQIVFELLKDGFTQRCYDGEFFFSETHPLGEQTVSNSGGGSDSGWYLLDASKTMKPLIFQKRRDYHFQRMTRLDDEAVFMRDEYRLGVDARVAGGYGFWQMAYGSRQPLDADNYAAARESMLSLRSDEGRPLNLLPNLLVVPPQLEHAARQIVTADRGTNGESNLWKDSAELVVSAWLS